MLRGGGGGGIDTETSDTQHKGEGKRRLYQYTAIKGVVRAENIGKVVSTADARGATGRKRVRGKADGDDVEEDGDGKRLRKKMKKHNHHHHMDGDGDGLAHEQGENSDAESEDAFATQATPAPMQDAKATRPVPYLTVYLSPTPVKELRDAYGEQVVQGA